jgi:hypothetical protein
MTGPRRMAGVSLCHNCITFRNHAFDEPKEVKAELRDECSHTHFRVSELRPANALHSTG